MSITTPRSRVAAGAVAAATIASALLAASPAQAVTQDFFFEQRADAFWAVPYECADGSVVQGTLLVEPTYDYFAPDTADQNPTARLQFLAVCSDGTSFSWGAVERPGGFQSDAAIDGLKSMTASGSGPVTDNVGGAHTVSFDAVWTGVGTTQTTVNTAGSKTKQRDAVATAHVVFDGVVIADGAANHPTRPAPFIREDTEK